MTEYNKVVYDGQTLIDLTQDDVTSSDVRSGVYFHNSAGVRGQGTLASTSTPTANTIAEWDSDTHMNSADMTAQEVEDFVDSLNISPISILDMFYPVGSYYETSDSTFNPNITWGGTWVLETEGQVHVSAGLNYEVGGALTNETDGGEATVTLTIDEMPSHNHPNASNNTDYNSWQSGGADTLCYTAHTSQGRKLSEWIAYQGGGQAHENMPPYIVVNRWHRTA